MAIESAYNGPFAFFKKHFNGDYSLGRSYWVNTFLISLFAPLLGVLILPLLGENAPARYASTAVLLLTVLGVAAWVWAVSGTWASANKHVSRGGRQFWASAAKVMIVLGIFKTIGDIGNASSSLAEHWKVALGAQLGPPTQMQIRADGKSLLLKGGINDGTAEELSKALQLAPTVTTVVLSSQGGWVAQGNRVGKVIADRKLNTYVEQECTSACTIAFLAGVERAAEPNARVGFHSFRTVGADSSTASTELALVQETYRTAGMSPAFITKIAATPHDKMWYPTHEELLAEGILTRTTMGGETATMATLATTRETLNAEFKKVPAFSALAERYPQEFDRVVDKAWEQIQARRPDGEVTAAARAQIGKISEKLLPIVADTTLLDFNLLIAAQADALSKKSPEACVELVFPSGKPMNMAALLPKDLATRELELMTEMIRTSDPRNARRAPKQEAEQAIQRVLSQLTSEQIQMLVSEQQRSASHEGACKAVIAYLRALNSIPEKDRARTLRSIYSDS
jgi:hypothetical protein